MNGATKVLMKRGVFVAVMVCVEDMVEGRWDDMLWRCVFDYGTAGCDIWC
jgi:hypothetical protein